MLNIVASVSIVIVWVLMWPMAIMHGRYMERPDSQGALTGSPRHARLVTHSPVV